MSIMVYFTFHTDPELNGQATPYTAMVEVWLLRTSGLTTMSDDCFLVSISGSDDLNFVQNAVR